MRGAGERVNLIFKAGFRPQPMLCRTILVQIDP